MTGFQLSPSFLLSAHPAIQIQPQALQIVGEQGARVEGGSSHGRVRHRRHAPAVVAAAHCGLSLQDLQSILNFILIE